MKRIITTAAALALTAGASAAAPSDATLNKVRQFVPNADVASFTDHERTQVLAVLVSGESDTTKRNRIQHILR
ncbi:hypothetical protein [Salipiger mucosus]|uniref:Uncharacterized protein n=1 Tax=Salipiger mucosus DSM 16094 TaxID=1123237 RepID=S9RJ43_9RHOB|nr:hypothetical protein [Salipiger mucosus]EPX78115.1 hypothetical protein Salmuc_03472 [Salipiger mucosus DSM 16094]